MRISAPCASGLSRSITMTIDLLTLAGFASVAFYLAAFAWFGRETLRVDELATKPAAQAPGARPLGQAACEECG